MKCHAVMFLGLLMLAAPLVAAQDVEMTLNMTLDGSANATSGSLSGCPPGSSCAVGYVNVTLVETPQSPITGMFLEQFDFEGFLNEIESFFKDLLGRL